MPWLIVDWKDVLPEGNLERRTAYQSLEVVDDNSIDHIEGHVDNLYPRLPNQPHHRPKPVTVNHVSNLTAPAAHAASRAKTPAQTNKPLGPRQQLRRVVSRTGVYRRRKKASSRYNVLRPRHDWATNCAREANGEDHRYADDEAWSREGYGLRFWR